MFPKESSYFQDGQILAFSKPYRWTSFDLVKNVKKIIQKKYNQKIKVGHAGTLDPLATGLIILCTGKATKKISEIQDLKKEYIATIGFGKTTPSFDLETEFNKNYEYKHITKELLESVLEEFTGEIFQVPPIFSARKYKGKRAYEYARKGENPKLKPSKIWIYKLDILDFNLPFIILKVLCSRGTYIRSLINDIGKALESGAYLKELKRTKTGTYSLKNAFTIESFKEELFKDNIPN